MSNIVSLKKDFANTIQNTNKRKSHNKYVTSKKSLENSDFKSFLDLYLSNETDFFERIDGYDGFISTQQIESIDYEDFSNHVFFDSAVEKVNYAFDKSINEFPYDSSKYKIDQYLKKLDGFTKYILDNKVEKSLNYLEFNGNTAVIIKDARGSILKDYTGNKILDNFNPNGKSISFDFWIKPKDSNSLTISNEECILQKHSDSYGFFITLTRNPCKLHFYFEENNSFFKMSYEIEEDTFQHVFFEITNNLLVDNDIEKVYNFYLNGRKISYINNEDINGDIRNFSLDFNHENFKTSDLYIGSSKDISVTVNNEQKNFETGFYGFLDDLKIFIGDKREYNDILKFKDENSYSTSDLVLYYKFNEPGGNYPNNNLIIDYSGNKLHGLIHEVLDVESNRIFTLEDFTSFTRNYNNNDTPLKYENINLNPVLFSSMSQTQKNNLLNLASEYDLENPNSFWKLFPKNIFLEGSDYDNIEEIYVSTKTKKSENVFGTEKSINQEIIKLISIWARFFDQIKMYIDSFTEMLDFSYDSVNTNKKIDGIILPLTLNQMGFKFREMYHFPIEEKLNNKNLTHEEILSDTSIRQIQNILWKRFILNSKDYLMSKGTSRSIRSVFNSFGLEADKFISIKEITGQNRFNITNQFVSRTKDLKFVDFNKHEKIFEDKTLTGQEDLFYNNRIFLSSDNIQRKINNVGIDWTYESYIQFDKNKIKKYNNIQTLLKVDLENNNIKSNFINVKFERLNNFIDNGTLTLSLSDGTSTHEESLNNINLLNGVLYHLVLRKRFNISRNKYEYHLLITPAGSLSYVKSFGLSIELDNYPYLFREIMSFNIGDYNYNSDNIEGNFEGRITKQRIYSKYIEDEIIRIKSKDIDFIGSNITSKDSGNIYNPSEGLILNVDMTEKFDELLNINNNFIYLNNFSTNNLFISSDVSPFIYIGDNLYTDNSINSDRVLSKDKFILLEQNNEIDTLSNSNKVYINSFDENYFKDQYKNYNLSESTQLHPEYLYHDDQRLYIDFSAVNFLNKDISKLLSINEYFTDVLSKSTYLYEQDYFDFRSLRDKYFERLKSDEEINFNMLYQVYKYFDNVLEDLLYEAIPSRVNYLGFNFVYESHILERNKFTHKNSDSRLPFSSSEEFRYQDYNRSIIKYRTDDVLDRKEKSVIKKKISN